MHQGVFCLIRPVVCGLLIRSVGLFQLNRDLHAYKRRYGNSELGIALS